MFTVQVASKPLMLIHPAVRPILFAYEWTGSLYQTHNGSMSAVLMTVPSHFGKEKTKSAN